MKTFETIESAVQDPQPGFSTATKREYMMFWFRYISLYDGPKPDYTDLHTWEGLSFDRKEGIDHDAITKDFIVGEYIIPQECRGIRCVVAWACWQKIDGKWVRIMEDASQ